MGRNEMIGAIIGDVVGSPYEGRRMKFFDYDFPLFNEKSTFTDDTILTVATAMAILSVDMDEGMPYDEDMSYEEAYLKLGRKYRNKGYGGSFQAWLYSKDPQPYNSWGNGSAMRISPIGLFYDKLVIMNKEVEKSSCVTHNHPDAVEGAKAIALAIHMAKLGKSKEVIKKTLSDERSCEFENDCQFYMDHYRFDVTCKGTVVQAMTAFFESTSFEDCIRKSVLMGGDTDTLACIAGSVAEAYYKYIPEDIAMEALSRVPDEFLVVIKDFYKKMKVRL
jgi:ADP-ribosylglycohydrolase